jgi:hypothetical protein
MKDFFESNLCKMGYDCVKCRRSSQYRKGIVDHYDNPTEVDFECPLGKEIEAPSEKVGIFQMSKSAAKALVEEGKAIVKNNPKVTDEERRKRWDICSACRYLENNSQCAKCRCFMQVKTKLRSSVCPIGKW